VNTVLVAGAVALSSRLPLWHVWRDNFLWSAPSFMVAGGAGAFAAVVVTRGEYWLAILLLAPVYLTYRTYSVFLGRIEAEQRHAAEARSLHGALAVETERLSVTLRSIADGVITTDTSGRIKLLNPAAETLTGSTQGEALDQPLSSVFRTLDRQSRTRSDVFEEFTRQGQNVGLAHSGLIVARDLTERPIEAVVAPLRDSAGRVIGMVLAFRDVSDALRVEAERARADKLASLGLLAGGIAHDFNNILMAIIGHVAQAQMVLPAADPAASALIEAEEACDRARQLTWRLFTLSKGGAPAKRIVKLRRLLGESARLALRGSNVECAFDIDDDLWPLEADDTQLVQVFTNLLINAQQAMPDGGTIRVRAENTLERPQDDFSSHAKPGSYVEVSIADEGTGIAPEHLGSIFDPYFTTKPAGSGLGLATSHAIVKNHGGFITVASIPGRGTTMHVYLPAVLTGERAEPLRTGLEEERRILVMEHDSTVRAVVADMLRALGYSADVVGSGMAVVEKYQHALASGRPYDAVILDLVVPEGIGGKEAMERLGRIDRQVPAILASDYGDRSMTPEYAQLGFKAVLAKPYTFDELTRTLKSVIPAGPHQIH
jgi:PAS domain S-box-containing protein